MQSPISEKHTLIICPNLPPMRDGLSGYTDQFAKELSKRSKVSVITSYSDYRSDGAEYQRYNIIKNWSFPFNLRLVIAVLKIPSNEILIQYLPFLYARRGGINFSIIAIFLFFRVFTRRKIKILIHEMYYPKQNNWKALLMHYSHRLMLWGVIKSAHRIFTTTEYFQNLLQRYGAEVLVVGANIEAPIPTREQVLHFKKKYNFEDKKVISLFGFLHPCKRYDLIFEAISKLEQLNNYKLLFIGRTQEDLSELLLQYPKVKEIIVPLGVMDDCDVVLALKATDLFVSYFCDGMSSRRGSVMGALKYHVPTVSTTSERTEDIFTECSYLKLLPVDEKVFVSQLQIELDKVLVNQDKPMSDFYKVNFSWKQIIEKYSS